MMLTFKDFVPKQVSGGSLFTAATYESLERAVEAAGAWIKQGEINVINIETVVLPNMHNPHEEGSTDASLWQGGKSAASWHQFIRVWYKS